MAVPARKVSKTRKRMRQGQDKLKAVTLTKCPSCGEIIMPHRACKKCGSYKGKNVVKKQEAE